MLCFDLKKKYLAKFGLTKYLAKFGLTKLLVSQPFLSSSYGEDDVLIRKKNIYVKVRQFFHISAIS